MAGGSVVTGPHVRVVPCMVATTRVDMDFLLRTYTVSHLDVDLADDGVCAQLTKRARLIDPREDYTEGMQCVMANVSEVTLLTWEFRTVLLQVDANATHQQGVLRELGLWDHDAWAAWTSLHPEQSLRPLAYALGVRVHPHTPNMYVTAALLVFQDPYVERHELSVAPGGIPLLLNDTQELLGDIADAIRDSAVFGSTPIRTAIQARTLHHCFGNQAPSPVWVTACANVGFRDADTFVDFEGEGHYGPALRWDQTDDGRWWRRSLLVLHELHPSLRSPSSACPSAGPGILHRREIAWYRTDRCKVMVLVPQYIPDFPTKMAQITPAVNRMCASRMPDGEDGVSNTFATGSMVEPETVLFVAYEVDDPTKLHEYFRKRKANNTRGLPEPVAFSTMTVRRPKGLQPWEWYNDVTCGVPGGYGRELLRLVFAIAYQHGVRAVRIDSVPGSVGAWERHGYTRRETHCRRVPGRAAPVHFQSEGNYGKVRRTPSPYTLMTRLVTEEDSFADPTVFRGEPIRRDEDGWHPTTPRRDPDPMPSEHIAEAMDFFIELEAGRPYDFEDAPHTEDLPGGESSMWNEDTMSETEFPPF